MKQKFKAEIEEWKTKLGDAQNTIAQLKIENNNKQQENKTLTSKYDMLEGEEVLLIGYKRLVPFRKTISPLLVISKKIDSIICRVNDKLGLLRERESHITNLEAHQLRFVQPMRHIHRHLRL